MLPSFKKLINALSGLQATNTLLEINKSKRRDPLTQTRGPFFGVGFFGPIVLQEGFQPLWGRSLVVQPNWARRRYFGVDLLLVRGDDSCVLGKMKETRKTKTSHAKAHTVDGRNPTPPRKPCNNGSPVNTSKQWLPMLSKCCERISFIHSR